jgi:hypothetical protein
MTSYDGTGASTDDDQDQHDPRCVAGWLPDTPDGLAVSCLICRPHLARRHDHLPEGPRR